MLTIDSVERAAINYVLRLADSNVVDMAALPALLRTADGKAAHKAKMTAQSIALPVAWLVTYSVESGHPVGLCRHISISNFQQHLVPGKVDATVLRIAVAYGFTVTRGQSNWTVWTEQLQGHAGMAVNIVQPVSLQ